MWEIQLRFAHRSGSAGVHAAHFTTCGKISLGSHIGQALQEHMQRTEKVWWRCLTIGLAPWLKTAAACAGSMAYPPVWAYVAHATLVQLVVPVNPLQRHIGSYISTTQLRLKQRNLRPAKCTPPPVRTDQVLFSVANAGSG